MDSPKSCKPTTTTAETGPAQESPIFNYISNLSPIQPVKAPSVTQGFPGLNSPPLVFTSPRLNPHSQPTLRKRAQLPGLLAAKLSGQEEGCQNSVTTVNASQSSDVQLNATIVTCNEKGSYSHSPVDDHIESPTGCSDQFLADVVNMDSVDPSVSSDSTVQKSDIIVHSPGAVTGLKEFTVKHDNECNKRICEEIAVAPPHVNGETEEVHKEDSPIKVSEVKADRKEGDSIIDQSQRNESELPKDHALKSRNQDSTTENATAELAGHLGEYSHLLSELVQFEEMNESSIEDIRATTAKPVMKKDGNDPEASQYRGVRRRCLQFEDALHKIISDRPPQNPSDNGLPKSLCLETPPTPINAKQADAIQPMYPRNMNSTIKIPKPSGIGLHLNSIVNAVQAGSTAIVHVKSAQRGNLSIRGKKSIPKINSHHCDSTKSTSAFSLSENVSASTEDNKHESHASLAATSATLSTFLVKPSNNSVVLNPVADQSTPGNKRKYSNTETDGVSEEFKSSLKKKRKKSSDSTDGDGCKRCNCKKSRCLKLYCDCFAAGIYCAEPCACQGCYNRPEFEDTVLETRQQIESRNPLAFAPKIVQHMIEPPASSYGEDGSHFTPSSARHKRGCNCKKSMCLKRYCECYQANVGCSDGCRCEGCKNVNGQKGEYGMIKDALSEEFTNEGADGSFIEKMVASGNGLYNTELCNPHNLTPLTPAVQLPGHRKDASKWLNSGEYLLSPECNIPFVASYMMSPGSPRNSDNNGMASETAQNILDLVSSDQQLYYGNTETLDEFSIVSQQPGKSGDLSGMPNPQEWANSSKAQSFSGNKQHSSVSSLRWRGSPNTPMLQFSGKPLKVVELDDELSNIMQDDTPDILKDSPAPLNAVKVSSPNKKRISPPHGQQHELGSRSMDGLRTARKFILKAVPSFPPLTPCIDSKSIGAQQKNDPQNCTGNK